MNLPEPGNADTMGLECTRRKVSCDKKLPCSRCVRLRKNCSRETVRTTKAVATNSDEIRFLRGLTVSLPGDDSSESLRRTVQERIDALEYSYLSPPSESLNPRGPSPQSPMSQDTQTEVSLSLGTYYGTPAATRQPGSPTSSTAVVLDQNQLDNAASMRTLESLVWGRNSGSCYPHRRCTCHNYRSYSEMASICCDTDDSKLNWTIIEQDPSLFLPESDARRVLQFHVDYLWWHHNAFYLPAFIKQCEIFWTAGTAVHPLWTALYLSVLSVNAPVDPLVVIY